jgi:molecular chaperone DnaJ
MLHAQETILIHGFRSSAAAADPNDPESHKNEGFLKSMWHTFTNHPAHQQNKDGATGATGEGKDESKAGESDEKPKKASDSSSG